MKPSIALIGLAMIVSGCGPGVPLADEPAKAEPTIVVTTSDDVDAAERVREALEKEDVVLDYVYQPDQAVQLQIGVADDGTRRDGLAQYFCMIVAEIDAVPPRAQVRIVDLAALNQSPGDFRGAEIGFARCDQ